MKRHRGNLNVYYKGKKVNVKNLPTYDSNCVTFWKRQNYEDSKSFSGCQGMGRDEEVQQKIFRALKLLSKE
jgi:hypothetical protein